MAGSSNIETLTEAIALLSTVSSKLSDRSVNQTADISGIYPKTSVKEQKQVVEKSSPVIVTEFGRKADEDLSRAFSRDEREEGDDKKEDAGFLSKILGPGTLLIFGALGGFISTLMSGGFGEIVQKFKGGDFKGALGDIVEKIGQMFSPILHSLPIIGPILSFWDAYKAFENGNLIEGLNDIGQGIVGLIPGLPMPLKAAIFGGMDIASQFIQNKVGKETIPQGMGSTMMSVAFKALGGVLKLSFLKRLPLIGSLINLYEAYEGFNVGGPAGILSGTMSLAAGISNLVPGVGTAVSIGLDVLRMFIFEKTKDEEGKTQISAKPWASMVGEFIMGFQPFKMIKHLAEAIGYFSTGDWESGFEYIGKAIPVLGVISDVIGGTTAVVVSGGSFKSKLSGVGEVIRNASIKFALGMLPNWLGKRVADWLGIEWDDNGIDDAPEDFKQEEAKRTGRRTRTNDFIKLPDEDIIQPAENDTLIGFKPGGPIDKVLDNKSVSTDTKAIEKLLQSSTELMNKQIDVLIDNHKVLVDIASKINIDTSAKGNNIITTRNTINNVFPSPTLRDLQGRYA